MAPQNSASHPLDDAEPPSRTVFIDTNLDTHLALIVSPADTVSDLKKKILLEHPLCFPKTGQIRIHAIKVKRRGYFYHLSDSMLVRSAFNGFNKSWFLSVDASESMEHEKNQISNSPGTSNQVVCRGIANNGLVRAIDIPINFPSKRASDFNCSGLLQVEDRQDEMEYVPSVSPCVSEHIGKGVVKNLETVVKPSGNDDCNVCEEGTLKSVPRVKEKRKTIRKKEDTVKDDAFKDKNTSVLGPGKLTVQQDILVPERPSEDASREFSHGTRMVENNIAGEQYQNSKRTSSEIEVPNEAFKETEISREHTECNNSNTKGNIDAECNKSMKEALEPESPAKKKHRKRKRSLTHDLEEDTSKLDSASQKVEAHKSNKTQKKSEETKDQVEFNNDKSGDGIEFGHDIVSHEPSDIGSPAKKKRKGKKRSGDESALKEKRFMISDSNKEKLKSENASQHFLEDLPKIRNSSADRSIEHFDDVDPLGSSALGSTRKKKKVSSNRRTAAVTSSRNDDEAEHSSMYGEGVQEEILKDGEISKDVSVGQIAGDNVEIGTDACKEGTMAKANSEDYCVIDMKVQKSDLNERKELPEDNGNYMHENISLDHCHLSEVGQTEQAEEGKELSALDVPKPLSESCIPSNQNNTDASIRELIVTSEVLEATGTTRHGKSEKKRRKKGNARDSIEGRELKEGFSHADAPVSGNKKTEGTLLNQTEGENVPPEESHKLTSCDPVSGNTKTGGTLLNQIEGENVPAEESHKATSCNPVSGNTKTEGTLLNQTEGENVPPEELKGTSLSTTDMEANNIDAGALEKNSKTEALAEKVEEKKSKKSKKKQNTTAKSVSEILTKDQILDYKEPSPTSDSRLLEEPSSKITKKNKSPSKKSTARSSGPISEAEEDFNGIEPPNSLSNAPKGNNKPTLGANDTAIDSTSSFKDEDNSHLEAPSKSDKVSAEQHFAFEQQQHKDIVSDNMIVNKNTADRTDTEVMTGKKRNRVEVMKGNTHTGSLSSTQQLLSKEGDGLQCNPGKKVSKLRRTGQEEQLSSQSNSVTSTIEEKKRRTQVNKASANVMKLEKKSEASPVSNSKLKGFKKQVQSKVEQASGNNFGLVLWKKEQKKSLLAGTIFNDENSGSSEDVDEKANDSSSSTRTPSDNSLSSDYSDGDSHAGSLGGKGLETSAKSSIKSRLSGTKGIPIESIIRNSRRYKKAKMTASQLEDNEIVPDSQVNL
ncbi:ankyrin repeat domain-containing protein 11-like [Senna tora]|uniref:Ankyrin repeat domain-containing protein 11-like n=1 Tax=Senna tora TaxID=362788 RepID=A0A834T0X9_9FABA|nr:ankyrin repeat domain-containing protein 11-like [Senna tora]